MEWPTQWCAELQAEMSLLWRVCLVAAMTLHIVAGDCEWKEEGITVGEREVVR